MFLLFVSVFVTCNLTYVRNRSQYLDGVFNEYRILSRGETNTLHGEKPPVRPPPEENRRGVRSRDDARSPPPPPRPKFSPRTFPTDGNLRFEHVVHTILRHYWCLSVVRQSIVFNIIVVLTETKGRRTMAADRCRIFTRVTFCNSIVSDRELENIRKKI